MISYFTPTHDPRYLLRAYASLEKQTNPDWEWVICTNSKVVPSDVAKSIRADCRVRVIHFDQKPGEDLLIGQLKNFTASQCRGELLAELDHDDELSWDCTEVLAKTHADKHADFYYSSTIEAENGKSRAAYSPNLGWRYSQVEFNGKTEIQTTAFPPSPAVFSRIWYAPNHIRAWSRDFYTRIGGHHDLKILDDQELMMRTYIEGKVCFIDKALYKYNIHADNTCLRPDVNPGIQTQTMQYHAQYALRLATRWAKLNGLGLYDVCCWKNKVSPDFVGVDISTGADLVCDLNQDWPMKDNSAGVIYARDALEHLRDAKRTMSEIHRVLAPGGWLISDTPSTDGRGAFQDPTHVSFWNSNSFWYYTQANVAKYIGSPVRFQCPYVNNYFPTEWHRQHNIVYVRADLIKLTGLDDPRLVPGLHEI